METQKLQSLQILARPAGSVDILILLFQLCIFYTIVYVFKYLGTAALMIYACPVEAMISYIKYFVLAVVQ